MVGANPFPRLVFGSIIILIAWYTKTYEDIDRAEFFARQAIDYSLPQIKKFDFIVVGAGSAGSVVANRLSKEFSVLLLESGGDPIPQTYVPANIMHLQQSQTIFYNWRSVQQIHSTLGDDGFARLGQGKFLGGTSVVNGLSYNRGHPKDYDLWAELTGDDAWKYDNLLPYFKRTEDFHEEENKDGHMGVGGPLTIRKGGKELKHIYDALLKAGIDLGYKRFGNSNAPQKEGFGPVSETLQFGRRVSAYDAFLKSILNRKTLAISKYSDVLRVNINKRGKAEGVFYEKFGVLMYAKARKEVILSAGSMNSPMILMRSGIGSASQLKAAGIPVKVDLPGVGQNFQDHPWSGAVAKFNDPAKIPLINFNQSDVDNFLYKGKGPMTLNWGISGQAFATSSIAKEEGDPGWPDILLLLVYNGTIYFPGGGDNTLVMLCLLGRVTSRGSLTLDPTNPKGPGIWDPRWLESERDVKVIAEGVQLANKIFKSQSFRDLGVTLDESKMKGCENKEGDEYWECYVRHWTRTTWHPVGTCAMGKDSDPNSVVDTQLRVKGVKGLRVIDNSIHPKITNANTNAPALVIGQKGAAMILKKYSRQRGSAV